MFVFTPKEDFYSPEVRSHYQKGLQYRVDNPLLGELVQLWLAEGKIEPAREGASMSGG